MWIGIILNYGHCWFNNYFQPVLFWTTAQNFAHRVFKMAFTQSNESIKWKSLIQSAHCCKWCHWDFQQCCSGEKNHQRPAYSSSMDNWRSLSVRTCFSMFRPKESTVKFLRSWHAVPHRQSASDFQNFHLKSGLWPSLPEVYCLKIHRLRQEEEQPQYPSFDLDRPGLEWPGWFGLWLSGFPVESESWQCRCTIRVPLGLSHFPQLILTLQRPGSSGSD